MILKKTFHILLILFLTVTTQIGGIIYIISLWLNKYLRKKFKFQVVIIFIGIYLVSTFLIVPLVSPIFGREKVRNSKRINPTSFITVLLNRNYVRPELNNLLEHTEKLLSDTNIEIHYLDANFPFVNKFPLLPHLSHNDGKKIDLSLIYENEEKVISNKQKSNSGYGVFSNPKRGESNQIEKCIDNGYFQYDYPKYLTFGEINKHLRFSENGTKKLIESILKQKNLGKIFIEPHLKERMNLQNTKIRYHGCRAVRHDDHIHIQLK